MEHPVKVERIPNRVVMYKVSVPNKGKYEDEFVVNKMLVYENENKWQFVDSLVVRADRKINHNYILSYWIKKVDPLFKDEEVCKVNVSSPVKFDVKTNKVVYEFIPYTEFLTRIESESLKKYLDLNIKNSRFYSIIKTVNEEKGLVD